MEKLNENKLLEQAFDSELQPDEHLLWTGRPAQGLLLRRVDIGLIPGSLLWGGFAFFWEFGVLSTLRQAGDEAGSMPFEVDVVFPLFGLVFCILGLYLIFGRFLHDKYRRQRTCYAITNKRIIIVSGAFGHSVVSHYLDKLANLDMRVRKDGSGSIRLLEPSGWFWTAGHNPWLSDVRHSLIGIDDVQSVYRLLQKGCTSPLSRD